jgi:hypothetical protein
MDTLMNKYFGLIASLLSAAGKKPAVTKQKISSRQDTR